MSEEKFSPKPGNAPTHAINQHNAHPFDPSQRRVLEEAPSDSSTQDLGWDGITPPPGTISSVPRLNIGSVDAYYPLPFALERHHPGRIRWRIELHGLVGAKPVGLDILGDVILGRGSDPLRGPDFDLSPHGAVECGVSRQHAILKPTPQSLYLLDLQSKNGTQYNGMPMLKGMARSLMNDDIITLGTLRFQVKIIDSPPMRRSRGS